MEALVRRPDTVARLLAQPWARALAVSALRALPAGLAAAAEQFAESYPRIKVKVNGKEVEVPEGSSILTACREAGAFVPTLCTHPRLPTTPGTCRVCLVDVGGGQLKPACATPAWEGLEVQTANEPVQTNVRGVLSLMKANHPADCMNCDANGRCEFQDLIARYDVRDVLPKLKTYSHEWDAEVQVCAVV
jgi:NADH-quinone oxidoreductase subunit G